MLLSDERARMTAVGGAHRLMSPVNGTDYAFLLNDDPTPYPDPRGLWQPHGVHGPSRVYDQQRLPGTTAAGRGRRSRVPSSTRCTSERSRTEGTFDAAIERLDYLFELGITHIELMPVAEFPGRYGWGYDGVALVCRQESLWRPGWPEAICGCVPLARARRPAGRGLQPLWAGGKLHDEVRSIPDAQAPHAVGRRGQLRRGGQR